LAPVIAREQRQITTAGSYYTYQAQGEPKFILQPADSQWFENLYQEAEALWDNATVHNLAP
jgi:hypothetical protein